MAEERKMLVRVELWPVKFVLGRVAMDEENEEGLLGLSPGIRLGVPIVTVLVLRSDAVKLWESLLDGPWGRPMILREAIWESEARFAGLSGADDALAGRGSEGAASFMVASFLESCSVGVVERWNRAPRPKMLRFLDEGSMIASRSCGRC